MSGHCHLEQGPDLMHVAVVRGGTLAEHQAHRLPDRRGTDGRDPQATTRAGIDDALAHERPHGLADDGAGDAELDRQLALGRQAIDPAGDRAR